MRTLCLLLALALLTGAGSAAHITDKLVVGLYADQKLEGEPLKLLTSGTPVEVLARGKGTVQVRMGDDTRGWLEARYVSEEKPAAMKLLEVQTELRRLKSQLKDQGAKDQGGEDKDPAQSESAGPSGAPASADQAGTQQELERANARIAELEAQVADLPRLQKAALQRNVLQARLNNIRKLLGVETTPAAGEGDGEPAQSAWDGYTPWVAAAAMALLGFVAGVAFVDYRFRRRHGGFRL
jgi:SH3 domain protein